MRHLSSTSCVRVRTTTVPSSERQGERGGGGAVRARIRKLRQGAQHGDGQHFVGMEGAVVRPDHVAFRILRRPTHESCAALTACM